MARTRALLVGCLLVFACSGDDSSKPDDSGVAKGDATVHVGTTSGDAGSANAKLDGSTTTTDDSGVLARGATTCRYARVGAAFVNSNRPRIHYHAGSAADTLSSASAW